MDSPAYQHPLRVGEPSIDGNGHVNNVEYVQWMQDAAIAHATTAGCTAFTEAAGATWVARSHHIEYLRPAFLGDELVVRTWVVDARRSTSRRCYEFLRQDTLIARGETEWVYIDAANGRPRRIPPEIASMLGVNDRTGDS